MATGAGNGAPMVFGKSASNRASVPSVRPRNPGAADAPASNVMSLELMRAGFTRGMYRVLLAHDLTVQSEIALVRASRLALERRGHLIILHIVDSRLPARVIEAQRTRARSYLEAEARKWLGRGRLTYSIDIGVGEPAGAIAARAQAHGVDLVVTGRHQRALAHGHIRAITVGRLLQQIQRPLFVVGNPNQSPYRRVLVPFDLSRASAARLQFAAAFLPQASLHLLHADRRRFQDYVARISPTFSRDEGRKPFAPIAQGPEQALSRFIATLRLGERRPTVTIENGDALLLVRKELARQKTDLLVLGTQARSGMEHAAIGGAAETALGSSRCDTLYLPLMNLGRPSGGPRNATGMPAESAFR
jgi:nucleotide-binding universal stress UspA family protein